MKRTIKLILPFVFVISTAHCAPDPPKETAPPTAPAVPATPEAPPPPVAASPLPEALDALEAPLVSPDAITEAVTTADRVDAWSQSHPDHEDTPALNTSSARLRLLAVAAASGLSTSAARAALEKDHDVTGHLRLAVKALETLATTEENLVLALRAAMIAFSTEGDIAIDLDKALDLALGTSLEGQAIRAVWLQRLENCIQKLHDASPPRRFQEFVATCGGILCPTCANAHHVTPDMTTRMLLNPKNTSGAICPGAVTDTPPTSVLAQLERLGQCKEQIEYEGRSDRNAFSGANFLASWALSVASKLAVVPTNTSAISTALDKRTGAIQKVLARPMLLPAPVLTMALPAEGPRANDGLLAPVTGLGYGGLITTRDALSAVAVSPRGIHVGTRPMVQISQTTQTLRSLSAPHEISAISTPTITLDDLVKAKRKARSGASAALSQAAIGLKDREDMLINATQDAFSARRDGARSLLVALDAQALGQSVNDVVNSFAAVGFRHLRFLKTATHGEVLPLITRRLPAPLPPDLKTHYENPITAHVTATHIDLWGPSKRTRTAELPTSSPTPPEGLEASYKGSALRRLRLPLSEGALGLSKSQKNLIQEGLKTLRAHHDASAWLQIIAGKGSLAVNVLSIAHLHQSQPGETITKPERLWADTRCASPGAATGRNRGKGCPTAIAVAFSNASIPSSRGLRRYPAGKRLLKKKVQPAKPAPSAPGFCSRDSIRKTMSRERRNFRFCYERELQLRNDPQYKGRVTMRFKIGVDGAVSGNPAIESATLKGKALHQCLVKAVKRIKFPPPDGGACTIKWPWKFGD